MADKERDDDRHFTGLGKCKIHTSRSHVKCSNAKKGCDHQENCDKLAVTWKKSKDWVWGDEWESHHILCISCVNGYMVLKAYKDKERTFIDNCYKETEWCINQKPNLIALPMKLVYEDYEKSRGLDLPCHDWDHNNTGGYTDEVATEINIKVWQKLKEKMGKEEPCDLAKSVVAKELVDLADDFRAKLVDRGQRPVGAKTGTQAAYDEGTANKPKSKRIPLWWFPFSMAQDSVAAVRPAASFGKPHWRSASDQQKLRKLFAPVKDRR
jgi:hypothetical protein